MGRRENRVEELALSQCWTASWVGEFSLCLGLSPWWWELS